MASMVAGGDTTALDSLLEKVYRDTGYDFREYKRGTLAKTSATYSLNLSPIFDS